MTALFLGVVLSAATNLLFSALALIGHSVAFLTVTVSADNLAGGLASAAFVAFLSGLTSKEFSATQYALLSSVMLLLPKAIAGFSGLMVEGMGYNRFFMFTAALSIPVAVLVVLAKRSGMLSAEESGKPPTPDREAAGDFRNFRDAHHEVVERLFRRAERRVGVEP